MFQCATRRSLVRHCAFASALGLAVAAGVAHADPDHRHPRVITGTGVGTTFGDRIATLDLLGGFESEQVVAVAEPYRQVTPPSPVTRGEITLYTITDAGAMLHSVITSPVVGSGFGDALAVGAFKNDTGDELVIGAPGLDGHGGVYLWSFNDGAPTLDLIYSDPDGDYALCGRSLAVGDFNSDGDDDIAFGCPAGDVGEVANAGLVQVGYGDGEGGFLFVTFSQESAGIEGGAETDDRFGYALAAGDFDEGNDDDLVIGVPSEAVGGTYSAGAIHVLFSTESGLTGTGSQLLHQGITGVPGDHQSNDRFGQSLAAGSRLNVLNTRIWYLAVGIPSDGDHLGGSVMVFKRDTDGLSTTGIEQITLFDFPMDWNGLSPHPEPGNPHTLGYELAIFDLNRDQQPDLMVSIAGAINALPLAPTPGMLCIAFGELAAPGSGLLQGGQRCFGGAQFGSAAANDIEFGVVATADFIDNTSGADLVIASPRSRQVFVLRNPLFGNGFEGGN
jgi:hypothetical protein